MPSVSQDQWSHVLWSLSLVVLAIVATACLFTALIVNNEKNIVKLFSPANASPSNMAVFSINSSDNPLTGTAKLSFVQTGSPVVNLPRQDVVCSILPSGSLAISNKDTETRPFYIYLNMLNTTGIHQAWIGDGKTIQFLNTTSPQIIQGYISVPTKQTYYLYYLGDGKTKVSGKVGMFIVSFR